jgi:AcrR family transcriptional regulator
MQRIERKSLTRPISKDNLQASTLNQRFDCNFQELRNTVTSEADCVNGRNLAEHQLCVRIDLDFFAALLESPFAGAPGFRVPKINQTMIAFLNASLDDIAKDADVGAGTLYRHFPTRDALIEAVYGTEVEKLAAAERKFTGAMPPIEALRAWMLLFVDYIATKQIIAPAHVGCPSKLYEGSRAQIQGVINGLVKRAIKSGDIRKDFDPFDLLRALIGVSNVASSPTGSRARRDSWISSITGSRPVK